MVNYKDSGERAKETATFRFTSYEKRLLAHLADVQGMTQTALIRTLLAERADQVGIVSLPEPSPRRKPGRPKKILPPVLETEEENEPDEVLPEDLDISERLYVRSNISTDTVGELIVRFQTFFQIRGEKMQHELESTIRFITGITANEVYLSPAQPLADIDAPFLARLRERVKDADIRFPRKNLHLTYLRMMFNFAVKEELIGNDLQPMETLRSFTAKEVADAFPLPIKTI
jgi:hypothetical protein